MRRVAVIACLALAGPVAIARADTATTPSTTTTTTTPVTTTTPATPVAPPPLRATLDLCGNGRAMTARVAMFTGSMPTMKGASRLWMRFELDAWRNARTGWNPVPIPGWGVWQRSLPDVPGFVYSKRVVGLGVPISYRATVAFRWYDDAGDLLRSRVLRTPACQVRFTAKPPVDDHDDHSGGSG